jgi:hypothetical protein
MDEGASVRESLEMPVQVHGTGEVLQHRHGLDVLVAEHHIALP